MYYEEGFAKTSGFSTGSKGTVSQNTAILGEDINNYGYDGAYAATTSEDNEDKKIRAQRLQVCQRAIQQPLRSPEQV